MIFLIVVDVSLANSSCDENQHSPEGYDKNTNIPSASRETLENNSTAMGQNDQRKPKTSLSSSDVLPFVLKGNELKLSEAPTDSTLPILPIFISHSPSSQLSNQIDIEPYESSHTVRNVENRIELNMHNHKSRTISCDEEILEPASGSDIGPDSVICTAVGNGRYCGTCYKCILSEDTCQDIIGSASELNNNLALDLLFSQSQQQQVAQQLKSNDIKNVIPYVEDACSHISPDNQGKEKKENMKNEKSIGINEGAASKSNSTKIFHNLNIAKTVDLCDETDHLKFLNLNSNGLDECSLDDSSQKIANNDSSHQNNLGDKPKAINISSRNSLFPENILRILSNPIGIATNEEQVYEKSDMHAVEPTTSEISHEIDRYKYSGYFKVQRTNNNCIHFGGIRHNRYQTNWLFIILILLNRFHPFAHQLPFPQPHLSLGTRILQMVSLEIVVLHAQQVHPFPFPHLHLQHLLPVPTQARASSAHAH